LLLDGQGHDVTLFERFESAQPIGSGIILQPTGLAVLQELGLLSDILRLGKRIDRMSGIAMPAGKRVLNVDYQMLDGELYGLAVHRAALFEVLFNMARSRAIKMCFSTEVVDLKHSGSCVSIIDTSQHEHGPFELLVDASGANTRLHRYSGKSVRRRALAYGAIWGSFDWPGMDFKENYLEQRYVGAHRMIGVLPIGQHASVGRDQVAFFWSMQTAEYDVWQAAGIDAWKKQVRAIWPETDAILDQIQNSSQMTLAQYGHHTMTKPWGDRVAFIGDAAHATSPQLGQGANMALLDAWALASSLENTNCVASALQNYAKMRRWHVRTFQLASLALTPFYQSSSRSVAWLRDHFFDPLSRLPLARRIVAGLVSGMLGNPLQKLELDSRKLQQGLTTPTPE
jgi:2-polyprenyl-6-methoxyphenol hydroxylase-like FAD-dependent oxidoreductase